MNPPVALRASLVLAALAAALAACAQNIVQDPSFENPRNYDPNTDSYDFSAVWNPSDRASLRVYANLQDQIAHSGNYFALLDTVGTNGNLAQTLTTQTNRTYTVSFYLQNYDFEPGRSNSLTASFGNGSLALTNVVESSSYTFYSFTGVTSGTSTVLRFLERNDKDLFFLDDVSVTLNPVPEPATFAVLGLPALTLLRRRKRA